MIHLLFGRVAAALYELRREVGQGTVEYVALILLVGAILTAVVAAGHGQNFKIAETIGHKLSEVINTVGAGDN
jgi:hypothetical protein